MVQRIKVLVFATVIAALFVAGGALAATQEGQGTVLAKIKVNPGPLTLTEPTATAQLDETTLTGSPLITTGSLGQFQILNARGNDVGWYLTMSAGDFTHDTTPTITIPTDGKFLVTNANYTNVSGSGGVTPDTGNLGDPGSPLNILDTGAGTSNGRGVDRTTPAVSLEIPGDAYSGNYTTTLTATLFSY